MDTELAPVVKDAELQRIKQSLPLALQKHTTFEMGSYSRSGKPNGRVRAIITQPLETICAFPGNKANQLPQAGEDGNPAVWSINVADTTDKSTYMAMKLMQHTTRLSRVSLPQYKDEHNSLKGAKTRKADKKQAAQGGGAGRGKGKGSAKGGKGGKGGRPAAGEINLEDERTIMRKSINRVLRRAPAGELNEEDLTFYLRTFRLGLNASTSEAEHDVYLAFPSPRAQYKCSIVLSRALGFNKVTELDGSRPWHCCDAGCCTLSSPSAPKVTCPVATHHTYLIASRPQSGGRASLNLPFELFSQLEELPDTTVHYNAQALNPLESKWITVRVASGAAVKANGPAVKKILKGAGKGVTIHHVTAHCELCGVYTTMSGGHTGHNTSDCPEMKNGDPHRMIIDTSALLYRGRRAKATQCKTAEIDACSDPQCPHGHHGCNITTMDRPGGQTSIYKELLSKPRVSKKAAAGTSTDDRASTGPIEINLGEHLLRPMQEAGRRKIKDSTASLATPINRRDIFTAAEKGSPAVTLQTAVSEHFNLVGGQACAPNVFANTDVMQRNSAVQAMLGGVKMNEEALIIPQFKERV